MPKGIFVKDHTEPGRTIRHGTLFEYDAYDPSGTYNPESRETKLEISINGNIQTIVCSPGAIKLNPSVIEIIWQKIRP
jgi:hypothetical protein